MKIEKEIRLIKVDPIKNSNKFWTGRLFDNGDVQTEYGRVGYSSQFRDFPGKGESFLTKKEREKEKKGYTPLKTVKDGEVKQVKNTDLNVIAKKQIKTNKPEVEKLIDRLVQSNIHKITGSTQISFNSDSGLFSTPLGIVTKEGIDEARLLLVDIKKIINNPKKEDEFTNCVGKYLRIVPQNVGMKLDARSVIYDQKDLDKQSDILDSLESSYAALQTNFSDKQDTKITQETIFETSLEILEKGKEWNRLDKFFEKSKKRMHGYDNIKIKNIYCVAITDNLKNFNKDLDNHIEVFHGTSEANLLSLLKTGFKITPPSTAYITGKLWGNGVYGAINSTKALGYCFGRWGGSRDSVGWLFVCDFAMGEVFYPNTYSGNLKPGYDSVWAKAKNTGLHNDELIVYKDNQVKIKYLIETTS